VADELVEKRARDAEQARILTSSPAWPWYRDLMEKERRAYLAIAFKSDGSESHRLQSAAVAYFIDWILAVPEKRVAELAAGQQSSAVDVLPRPPRSSDAATLV
jgi:hypothetical protein